MTTRVACSTSYKHTCAHKHELEERTGRHGIRRAKFVVVVVVVVVVDDDDDHDDDDVLLILLLSLLVLVLTLSPQIIRFNLALMHRKTNRNNTNQIKFLELDSRSTT